MSIKNYETALQIIAEHPDLSDFDSPAPEQKVEAAEEILGLTFPPSYRRFLLDLGVGGFGSQEIYGITPGDLTGASVPNGIWYTLIKRERAALPKELVVVYGVGDGELFCIDTGVRKDGECPVIAYQPGFPSSEQRREVVAEDFGALLLELVQRELLE